MRLLKGSIVAIDAFDKWLVKDSTADRPLFDE
jgi:hypothetical protein